MRNNISIDEQVLSTLRQALAEEHKPSEVTAWDLVRSMTESLKSARAQGKTLEQMHTDLIRCGIDIKLGTFRKYASDLLSDDAKPPKRAVMVATKEKQIEISTSLRSMRSGPKPTSGMGY